MRYETIEDLKDTDFKRLTGVQHETFDLMLKVVEKGLRDFGRPTKLSRADQLLLTLMYWREYRTEFHIAQSYGISEATVCRTIQKVENTLGAFRKVSVARQEATPSQRHGVWSGAGGCQWTTHWASKKSQKRHYSGKKKRHTQKAQVIAEQKSAQIVATAFSYGSKHDFQLFKDDGSDFAEHLRILAELHENCQTPFKKSKYHALTEREKQKNRVLARKRMVIEHIFRTLKVFRILSERYRNRRKRFALRFNLIAAIYNLELNPEWLLQEV